MKRLLFLLLTIGFGAILMYGCLSRHIVITETRTIIVPKQELSPSDIYVDVRKWSVREWGEHPKLVQALVDAGYQDEVRHAINQKLFNEIFQPIRDQPWYDKKKKKPKGE